MKAQLIQTSRTEKIDPTREKYTARFEVIADNPKSATDEVREALFRLQDFPDDFEWMRIDATPDEDRDGVFAVVAVARPAPPIPQTIVDLSLLLVLADMLEEDANEQNGYLEFSQAVREKVSELDHKLTETTTADDMESDRIPWLFNSADLSQREINIVTRFKFFSELTETNLQLQNGCGKKTTARILEWAQNSTP